MNQVALYTGLAIVVGSHLWLIADAMRLAMPPAVQKYHAIGNLAAAGLITYGVILDV
jgi:hypothetical protein